jgi:hypothetical protein
MFTNDDRFDEERLRLKLSEVKSDEFELLGVMREFPRLLDGLGTSYESSILNKRLVAVLEVDKIDCRLKAFLALKFSLFTGTAGFGIS